MNLGKLLQYPSGKQAFFEVLSQFPNNWQCNPTPYSLINKMIDKTSLHNKNILVLFNIEFVDVLVNEKKINPKNIFYVADNHLEMLSAKKIHNVDSYSSPYENGIVGLQELIKSIEMKFDLVFSNPPYNANTDIKILNKIINLADEWVIVHPSTWILDRKGKTNLFTDLKKNVIDNLVSVDFFNGNNIFDIELFVPCMITHVNKRHSGNIQVNHFNDIFSVDDIDDITKFGNKWLNLIKPFVNQFINTDSILNYKTDFGHPLDNSKFYCQLAGVRGTPNRSKNSNHMLLDDFYTMVMKTDGNKGVRNSNVRKDAWLVWEFNTEFERDNFLNYLKTDFARFLLAILKNTQNNHYGEMSFIPWLDFTEEWDDAKLYKQFNVSQELQDYITDFLPDFHNIR